MKDCYYFGCWNEAGHHLWEPGGKLIYQAGPYSAELLDAGFVPQNINQDERPSYVHHFAGWTILAMWDRSVDSRPGSNCAFFINRRELTESQMWDYAQESFPQIVARLAKRRSEL